MNEQAILGNGVKLALKFELSGNELKTLCAKFAELKIGEDFSPGMKAVSLVRMVKQAMDFKFENIVIEEKHHFHPAKEAPLPDNLKAKIVKGLFLTFIEHQRGLPGLVSILSGTGAAGFGYGSFQITEFSDKIRLDDLNRFSVDSELVKKTQADFFDQTLIPEILSKFSNVRTGVYCLIVAGALIPVYAAACRKFSDSGISEEELLQKALAMVKERFSPESEKLQRFTSQNLFRVIFEELFNYESTVYSIYS